MDDNTAKVLLATVPAAISAGVTWLATRTSQRSFFSQRWWERKAQTYDNIIGALSELNFILGGWERHFQDGVPFSDEYRADLVKRHAAALDIVKKLSGTGGFLITPIAASALRRTTGILDTNLEGHPLDDIEKDFRALAECMLLIKSEAAQDLHIL